MTRPPKVALPIPFATMKGHRTQTVGTIFLSEIDEPLFLNVGPGVVKALANLFPCKYKTRPCAWGKIGFLNIAKGVASSWQASKTDAQLAACGNLTAALFSLAGSLRRTQTPHLNILIDAECGTAVAGATLTRHSNGGHHVGQRWVVEPPSELEIGHLCDGRPFVRCRWLNEYVVIPAGGPLSPEELRNKLTTGDHRSKVITIEDTAKGCFAIQFNSNGRHGGMAMTGLITLALLKQEVEWLSRIGNRIHHGQGEDRLPDVERIDNKLGFIMPDTHVLIRNHAAQGNSINDYQRTL